MAKKIIHVDASQIRKNENLVRREPVIVAHVDGVERTCDELEIRDREGRLVAAVVYRPDAPLGGGQQVWIETADRCRLTFRNSPPVDI